MRPLSPPSFRFGLIAATLLVAAVVLVSMSTQIVRELTDLRSAPNDLTQWSTAQMDVELLVLCSAAEDARFGTPGRLEELRKRFDVFYSRVASIGQIDLIASRPENAQLARDLRLIRSGMQALIPLIDGPDASLQSAIGDVASAVAALRPTTRHLTLESVRLFAQDSDTKRQAFSVLLLRTALAASALIIALAFSLVFLIRQHRVSVRRSTQVQQSNERYASAINASLDAIIVCDAGGSIIDFNPAAELTFGYSRNVALGGAMADLIVPSEAFDTYRAASLDVLASGQKSTLGRGRIETRAVRADGEEFPVEMSLGVAAGTTTAIFIAYIRDISDRIRIQSELTSARDEALSAAKTKSQFLAIMSHEMRTPLNGVIGMLDLLNVTRLAARQRRYVETAARSAAILQFHIDDVLEITQIEAGRLTLRPAPFDLAAMLQEVKAINDPAAAERGNVISVRMSTLSTGIVGDRHRLRQILLNLVSNAVKFTEAGRIEIAARADHAPDEPATLELSVSDSGIGIAPQDTDRIFENFVTLDPSYRRTAPGYGLGLAICRRIARAMGGDIGVTSTVGEGSRFWIRVPVTVSDEIRGADLPASAPADRTAPCALRLPLKVLLVEDNETNRFVAREMLEGVGCAVTEAKDGGEGVGKAESGSFDLILMDLSMPRVDGLEATRRIRASKLSPSRDAPIVGLTAHALPKEQESLREAGMQDCLVKPLRIRALRDLLERFAAKRSECVAPDPASARRTGGPRWTVKEPEALDAEVLTELSGLLTSETLKVRMASFQREVAEVERRLARVDDVTDLSELASSAHRASGSAAMFGAMPLREALVALENACRAGSWDLARPSVERASVAAKDTLAALDRPLPLCVT